MPPPYCTDRGRATGSQAKERRPCVISGAMVRLAALSVVLGLLVASRPGEAAAPASGLPSAGPAVSASAPSAAPGGGARKEAIAEALFDEGVALLERGQFDAACAKLEESQRLDPGGGTMLNIARCHEGAGRIATAWSAYRAALALAHRDAREDRIHYAEAHLAALTPRLPKLVVRVVGSPDVETEVLVDGVRLGAAAWGSPQPVDIGKHRIEARAPGRRAFTLDLAIAERETRDVLVPELAIDPSAWTSSTKDPALGATATNGLRTLGYVSGGLGVAALVTGGILGALALDADGIAERACPGTGPCTNPRGLDASDRAQSFATSATISFVSGAVLLAAGIVLLVTSPRVHD